MSDAGEGDVGICVSGGGLRAASFATGALQALDARLGLLRGKQCARYLSAVSGGSYIAGAFTLVNAGTRIRTTDNQQITGVADLSEGDRPFAPGSPEADHLGRHCSYLIEDGGARTSMRLIGLILAGVATSFVIMAWLGNMLIANLGHLGADLRFPPKGYAWTQWLVSVGYIGSLVVTVVVFVLNRRIVERIRSGVGRSVVRVFSMLAALTSLAAAAACAPSFISRLRSIEPIGTPSWWSENVFGGAIVVGSIAAVLALLRILRHPKLAGALLLLIISVVLRVALLLAILWIGFYIFDRMQTDDALGALLFMGILLAGVLVLPLPGRASPHRPYRDMLSRCFVITRGEPLTIPARPERIALSSLRPPDRGRADSFPKLIICAAANVSDVGASAAGTNVVPLLITPDYISVPDVPEAAIPIERFEQQTQAAGLLTIRKREPLMSLPTAVAITGAAVSPAMGRMTNTRLRQLITIMNLRLGVWLPNPLNKKIRESSGKFRLASGADLFLLEFLGAHSSKSSAIFASDGGHYENLGLVELIRRRCSTIWCIDSSGGKAGNAASLAQSILLAETVTGARIDLDIDRFAASPGNTLTHSRVRDVFAIGQIHYPDRPVGCIIVIKLGLTELSPAAVREYQKTDPAFPHHSTLNQVFRAERFIAYRRLGWDSATKAIDAWKLFGDECTDTATPTEMPPPAIADGSSVVYSRDANGLRHIVIDPAAADMTGWCVETADANGGKSRSEFTRDRTWYRNAHGVWNGLRGGTPGRPWAAIVESGKTITAWIPPLPAGADATDC